MSKPKAFHVVCVANLKGGSGKTTIAALVAASLHRRGRRVVLVDSDPQRSATHWRAASAEVDEDAEADLPTVVAVEAPAIKATVNDLGRAYEVVVVDTPARLAAETRKGLLAAGDHGGLALVPMSASGVDLRATAMTAELVGEARDFRDGLDAAIVRNRWADRLRLSGDVEASLGALGLDVLETTIAPRTAYAEAVSHGLAVEDTGDPKAAGEVGSLVDELLVRLTGGR